MMAIKKPVGKKNRIQKIEIKISSLIMVPMNEFDIIDANQTGLAYKQ